MKLSIIAIAALAISVFAASAALGEDNEIFKIGSDIVVEEGRTVGDVTAIGGNVTVSGRVEGEIFVLGGRLTLKPGSYVRDDITVIGGSVVWEPGAAIGKGLNHIRIPRLIPTLEPLFKGSWIIVWATLSLLALAGIICLAVLLAALLPEHLNGIIGALEASFLKTLLWGILWAITIVPIAILLAISIVGIILIPLEILLVGVALIVGYIAAAMFLGRNVLKAVNKGKAAHPVVEILIGIAILFFIGFLPVVGAVVKALLVTAGFGAVIVTRFGARR
jgi:hypothetical protein